MARTVWTNLKGSEPEPVQLTIMLRVQRTTVKMENTTRAGLRAASSWGMTKVAAAKRPMTMEPPIRIHVPKPPSSLVSRPIRPPHAARVQTVMAIASAILMVPGPSTYRRTRH
jgi:hypothetical protein